MHLDPPNRCAHGQRRACRWRWRRRWRRRRWRWRRWRRHTQRYPDRRRDNLGRRDCWRRRPRWRIPTRQRDGRRLNIAHDRCNDGDSDRRRWWPDRAEWRRGRWCWWQLQCDEDRRRWRQWRRVRGHVGNRWRQRHEHRPAKWYDDVRRWWWRRRLPEQRHDPARPATRWQRWWRGGRGGDDHLGDGPQRRRRWLRRWRRCGPGRPGRQPAAPARRTRRRRHGVHLVQQPAGCTDCGDRDRLRCWRDHAVLDSAGPLRNLGDLRLPGQAVDDLRLGDLTGDCGHLRERGAHRCRDELHDHRSDGWHDVLFHCRSA